MSRLPWLEHPGCVIAAFTTQLLAIVNVLIKLLMSWLPVPVKSVNNCVSAPLLIGQVCIVSHPNLHQRLIETYTFLQLLIK